MDIVQNYVASYIHDRPNIGVAIKGSHIDSLSSPPPPFSFASPFYFSRRNYRETSALLVRCSRLGVVFSAMCHPTRAYGSCLFLRRI